MFPYSSGGRFCSFSPCIEQTQRCCEVLQQNGFVEIQSMEVLQVEEQIRTKTIPVLELDFLKHKVNNIIQKAKIENIPID